MGAVVVSKPLTPLAGGIAQHPLAGYIWHKFSCARAPSLLFSCAFVVVIVDALLLSFASLLKSNRFDGFACRIRNIYGFCLSAGVAAIRFFFFRLNI